MPRHFRIHPAIGVARMGNSPEHFIGPETPGVPSNSDDGTTFKSFRDSQGRILRQGSRFRVFEYTESTDGSLSSPREVTSGGDVVNIEWRVHLANRKASFFTFYGQSGASDLYVTRKASSPTAPIKPDEDQPARTNLRNANVISDPDRRDRLDIDPGEQLISRSQSGPVELLNTKAHIPIRSLGTLRLDTNGNLIVVGGYGESNSTETPPRPIDEYANNDAWFDDASDGSVKARIILSDGSHVDADPAWVLVGPPDFAPGVGNVVSLFDTLCDTAVREIDFPVSTPSTPRTALLAAQKAAWQNSGGRTLDGFRPSFTRDIYPLLKRALGTRDVHVSGTTANKEYHQRLLGNWAALSSRSGPNAEQGASMRQGIMAHMRDPEGTEAVWDTMPRGLGDEYTTLNLNSANPLPRSFLSLTRIQYAVLKQWAAGNFDDDWPGAEPTFSPKLNPAPDELDCAAVENCVGGPFYPGIEVSWLIRVKELYSEPFRLKIPREPEDVDSSQTTPLTVGALNFRPGFFSQQMALPWQADFYDCHKERWEDPDGAEYYFMWWTAQRPDDVFPNGGSEQVRWVRAFDDQAKSAQENDDDNNRFVQMQSRWFQLKFVSVKNGNRYEEES